MNVSNVPALPALVAGSALVISQAVFGLLLLFQAPIASLPGFRANDGTRNAFLRALVFLLNLGALVGLAWTQNVVITRAAWPELLATAALAGGVSTGAFFVKKAATTNKQQQQQQSAPTPPAVPPLPSDPLPVPVPVPVQSAPATAP